MRPLWSDSITYSIAGIAYLSFLSYTNTCYTIADPLIRGVYVPPVSAPFLGYRPWLIVECYSYWPRRLS